MLHYYDKILRLKSKLIVGKTGKQSRLLGHTWPVGTKVTWIWIALSWIIIYKETYKLTCEFLEKKIRHPRIPNDIMNYKEYFK